MASFKATGRIISIGGIDSKNAQFPKRELILDMSEEYNGKTYDNPVPFTFTGKNVDKTSVFNEGDTVTLTFNLKGRKWVKDSKETHFLSLDVFKIER